MIKLFLFFSLLAASADGFVSGLLMAGLGLKIDFKAYLKITGIVLVCCFLSSAAGNMLAYAVFSRYINLCGVLLMLYLSYTSLKSTKSYNGQHSLTAIAFSVAADASIVCMYLAACGYSIFLLSTCSAVMHSVLMTIGEKTAHLVLKEKIKNITGYISAIVFLAMAAYKTCEMLY